MKTLGGITLFIVLVIVAGTIAIQALVLSCFANDSEGSLARRPRQSNRNLWVLTLVLLGMSIVIPTIQYGFDQCWNQIIVSACLGFGGSWILVLLIIIRTVR